MKGDSEAFKRQLIEIRKTGENRITGLNQWYQSE